MLGISTSDTLFQFYASDKPECITSKAGNSIV